MNNAIRYGLMTSYSILKRCLINMFSLALTCEKAYKKYVFWVRVWFSRCKHSKAKKEYWGSSRMGLPVLTVSYVVSVVCIFISLHLLLSEERITNLEMACYLLIAIFWPIEVIVLLISFIVIGPLIYMLRFMRRASTWRLCIQLLPNLNARIRVWC